MGYNQFPPDNVPEFLDSNNKPFLSWRVHLLPYLGYGDLYQQFHLNEPWNSANNLPLLSQMPEVYRSRDLPANATSTGFQRITSSDAYHIDGSGGPSLSSVKDNPATTLLLLETTTNQAVPWTASDDALYSPTQPLNILTPAPADYTLALMADGTVHRLNPNIAAEDFRALVTWQGREVISSAREANIFVDPPSNADLTSPRKLKQLGLAMNNYHDLHATYPPDNGNNLSTWFDASGKPYLSWRVFLLPQLGFQSLFDKFHLDEPWDSPNNLPLAAEMPEAFRSRGVTAGSGLTAFKVISGQGAYSMNLHSRHSISMITDGTSNTLAVIELPSTSSVTWTRPDGDIAFNPANPLGSVGPIPAAGLWTVMFDGYVHHLSPQITPANFAAIATWQNGEFLGPAETSNAFTDWSNSETIDLRTQKLKQIGLAFLNYGDAYSYFPINGSRDKYDAAGMPLLSWRVYLLPFLDQAPLFNQFHLNEPWNSPNNLPLLDKMPEIFRSRGIHNGSHKTGIQILAGKGAYDQPLPDNIVGYGPRLRSMIDGPSNTILALETPPEAAVDWTRPDGDIQFDLANPLKGLPLTGLKDVAADGVLTLFGDGSVGTLRPTISAANFSALATWGGNEVIGPTERTASRFDSVGSHNFASPQQRQNRTSTNDLREIMLGVENYNSTFQEIGRAHV